MRIVVFGAGGKVGSRLVREGLSRGHSMIAAVRDPAKITERPSGLSVVSGDATDAESVARAAAGAEAAVNAIGPAREDDTLVRAAIALEAGLPRAGMRRLLIVGGAGSLELGQGRLVIDTIPAEWRWIPKAHMDALAEYRKSKLDWSYLSPAGTLEPGIRTGKFRLGGDRLLVDASGSSRISMEDLAMAIIDELEEPHHLKMRFTVAY